MGGKLAPDDEEDEEDEEPEPSEPLSSEPLSGDSSEAPVSLPPEVIELLASIDERPSKDALKNARATPVLGTVRWSRDRSAFDVRDDAHHRDLRMAFGNHCEGRYRFLILDDSDVIVAAEPLDHPLKYDVTHRALLLELQAMTEADLAKNRKGELTEAQTKQRSRNATGTRIVGLFVWMMFAITLAFTFWFSCNPDIHAESWLSLLLIAMSTGIGFLARFITNAARKLQQNIKSRVVSIDGELTDRSQRTVKNTTLYSITIGDKRFDVGPGLYSVVCTNIPYRAHYAKGGDELIALEPIAPDPATPYR